MCPLPYTGTKTGVATTRSPIRYPPSQGAPAEGPPAPPPPKRYSRRKKAREEEEEGEDKQGAGGQAVAQADINSIT